MSNPYISSIVSKYGDTENVKQDAKTIKEIFDRQGFSLFFDALADKVGTTCVEYKIPSDESEKLVKNLVAEFKSALNERI